MGVVQGNCSSKAPSLGRYGGVEPADSPLRTLLPGQCVTFADQNLIDVSGDESKFFLKSVYVRLVGPRPEPEAQLTQFMSVQEGAKVRY